MNGKVYGSIHACTKDECEARGGVRVRFREEGGGGVVDNGVELHVETATGTGGLD